MESKEARSLAQTTGTEQVTNWHPFNEYGATAYRIHFKYDAVLRRFMQAHEWQLEDGGVEMERWIITH